MPKLSNYGVVVFYYNPNIHPRQEYELRKKEVIRYCDKHKIVFIEGSYDIDYWFSRIRSVPNYALEPEGGLRCEECFRIRLERTAEEARKLGIKFFSTTLTLGSNKQARTINKIGVEIAERFGLFFVQADFKKKGGQELSVKESKAMSIYRQDYCGCVFSMRRKIEFDKNL